MWWCRNFDSHCQIWRCSSMTIRGISFAQKHYSMTVIYDCVNEYRHVICRSKYTEIRLVNMKFQWLRWNYSIPFNPKCLLSNKYNGTSKDTHSYVHAHIHTYTHTRTCAYICIQTNININIHRHLYIRAYNNKLDYALTHRIKQH